MTDLVAAHATALAEAFADILDAEDAIRNAKVELEEQAQRLNREIHGAEFALRGAWDRIAALLAETGEVETTLPGDANDYRIYWQEGRESVKAEEPDAVPDQFVKLERKPKLKEIGDHLRCCMKDGIPLPNWARLERSPKKLCWKAVKK